MQNELYRRYVHPNSWREQRHFPIEVKNSRSHVINMINLHKKYTLLTIPIGRKRYTVLNPFSQKWTIGFLSYDGRGIVWRTSGGRWFFYPVQFGILGDPFKRALSKHDLNRAFDELMCRDPIKHDPTKYPYPQLAKAEKLEQEILDDLKTHLDGLYLRTYDRSGFKLGGVDISISIDKIPDYVDMQTIIDYSICIIECLGITCRKNGKEVFNHKFKNFQKWFTRCNENNILPVFAFKSKEFGIRYVIVDDNILKKVFYSKRTKKMRKTYSPVSSILPFSISANEISAYIWAWER